MIVGQNEFVSNQNSRAGANFLRAVEKRPDCFDMRNTDIIARENANRVLPECGRNDCASECAKR